MKYPPIYYGDYLKLDSVLNAQNLKSTEYGNEAHDETLFIIIHQVYELWFKQILHELKSIYKLFDTDKVHPTSLSTITHRLNRIIEIQRLLNDQLAVIETMTPLDFMEFRDYLVPASGFQSVQFREIEILLGLKSKYRLGVDKSFFNSRLRKEDREYIEPLEQKPSLLDLIDKWLSRMPFTHQGQFDFWKQYQVQVEKMLARDLEIIQSNNTLSDKAKEFELKNLEATRNSFNIIFDEKSYQELIDNKSVKISRSAKLAALFIKLFGNEPILQLPNLLITQLIDIDENFTTWRYKHAIMAHRMLGTKIGTGGSSGHDYLKKSTENNRVFVDFFNLATFLLPREHVPALPKSIRKELSFTFEK